MVDNRYATALVIGSVLSLLATVYLSVAVGTQHWYQYTSPPNEHEGSNASEHIDEFVNGEFSEKSYSETMFLLNGTLGLWWRCILGPSQSHWFKEPDPKLETKCVSFTLPEQFNPKYTLRENDVDLLRTYLWRCQFLLPLVSLALVFLSGLIGVCACLCRSFTPTLGVGVLHLLAGLCSLGTVCCFLAGVDLRHQSYKPPERVEGSLGWSLYLALISFPLQMMAAALFLWAARSHRKNYTRMTAYRVA
ncbi:claudin domain-containing protein 1-like isoform X2 [Mastacembelus armatus]|uniref:Claudin domain containing 1b n=1 Tax=Mastacembelus armatus TaxID=205130 RepID=A0A3Q3MB47_9TELE|nr:claudin domain-containing protein 1-like [Mastacembelus armatus]XP_026158366.1 claudin domain-containing protein 1-like [Mastacembelus armatus]XP_026158367.1 claudin domain-containing protein 1-like [Mastacembelus armatus]XP_026158368.1 claudin domain-containing protein 1-like [Mastacembelus armatus]XP_026158407.1 claudin domain-containing protein 1-like isoform X2 [Mastacembelus armatus]XP_026158408.1 claudin domain-containing protein 1-like isoform X2 [Mastacembelus armatus]